MKSYFGLNRIFSKLFSSFIIAISAFTVVGLGCSNRSAVSTTPLQSTKPTPSAPSDVPQAEARKALPPEILAPEKNPYYSPSGITIKGSCEPGNVVQISRDGDSNLIPCEDSGYFSFTESKISTNAPYNFIVSQKDPKSDETTSNPVTLKWFRSDAKPQPPKITFPFTATPYISADQITISGTCDDGNQVSVVLRQRHETSCDEGEFSILIDNTDEKLPALTHTYKVFQESPSGISSDALTGQWQINPNAFSVSYVKRPSDPNVVLGDVPATGISNVPFQFSSNYPNSTFRCKLDAGAEADCPATYTLSGLSSGKHTLTVRALNPNSEAKSSSPLPFTWRNEAYPTVALYHLDEAVTTPPADFSLYTAKNTLTNTSTAVGTSLTGFSKARIFGVGKYLSVTSPNSNLNTLMNSTMTAEAFVQISRLPGSVATTTLPKTSPKYVIASKMGAAGNYGWEYGIKWISSGVYRFYFAGSQDGKTLTEVQSPNLSATQITALTKGFNHAAVTFEASTGLVQFYFAGTKLQPTSPTTLFKHALFPTTNLAKLRIGATATAGNEFIGMMDEVRLSRVVRYTANFTVPKAPYPN